MGLRMQVFGHLLLHLLFSSYFDSFRCEAGQPQGGEVVQLLMDGVPWHALVHRYSSNISGLVLFRCRRETDYLKLMYFSRRYLRQSIAKHMFSLGLLGWSFEVQVSIRRLELQVSKLGAEVKIVIS